MSKKIIEFFIFHRNGTCLCHLDKFEEQNQIINKVINASSNKETQHRYKLIYGVLFSMKSCSNLLIPIFLLGKGGIK